MEPRVWEDLPYHQKWEGLLKAMSEGRSKKYEPGGSPAMLAKVLSRVALAGGPVARSEISKGSMLIRRSALASGTVGKATGALLGEGFLIAEEPVSGQPGPPITPLRFGDKWATIGIHIDQQHDGPDLLTGVICGLDRQPLIEPVEYPVPMDADQHELRVLAEHVRDLAESLLAKLGEPRTFLGVGVELGGHVYRGTVHDSTHAGWDRPIKLRKALTEELSQLPDLEGVPVVIENDVNALAIQRYYDRSFDGLDVALVAVFRQGIGGALIIDGRMYRGARGVAPEPGHLAVEYPQDDPGWQRPPTPNAATGRTFADECLCSTLERKAYGHVDTLATPARIEGELASRKPDEKVSLERAASTPVALPSGGQLVFTEEAVVLQRAGRALGRGLTDMINIVNPGQLVLLLPEPLAFPAPQTSGTEYLDAIESEIDRAYSTAADDARGDRLRLTIQKYVDEQIAYDGAIAAATTAFNAFTEHARGSDGCPPASEKNRQPKPPRTPRREPRSPAALRPA